MPQLTPTMLNGLVITTADVLEGSATLNNDKTYTFTTQSRGSQLGKNATFTFSNPNDAANTITVTVNGTGNPLVDGSTLTATLLGNDSMDFLLSGSFPPFGAGNALIANTAFNGTTGAGGVQYPVQPLGPNNTYTPPTTACFAGGTRIRTPTGDVAVETLCEGDLVLTHDGRISPITWIGSRLIRRMRENPRSERVQPIRIQAKALDGILPERDLLLSPDHALYLQGHLIPAKSLLNGASIVQLDHNEVTYHHIELATHSVLIAEGTPCESYLDTGNRHMFDSAVATIHPDFTPTRRETQSCAPFVLTGEVVERIRAEILSHADIQITDDPALTIEHDTDGAIIRSRTHIAGDLSLDPTDRRRLGVKIAAIWIGPRRLSLDDAALTEGWHDVEPRGRWTNGAARIPAALLAGCTDIEVELAATGHYRIAA